MSLHQVCANRKGAVHFYDHLLCDKFCHIEFNWRVKNYDVPIRVRVKKSEFFAVFFLMFYISLINNDLFLEKWFRKSIGISLALMDFSHRHVMPANIQETFLVHSKYKFYCSNLLAGCG